MIFPSYLFLGLVIISVQSTILHNFQYSAVTPDLTLIFVIYLGIFYGQIGGILLSFFLGYMLDIVSGSPFGVYTLLRIVIFILTKQATKNFYFGGILPQLSFVFLLSILDGILLVLVLYLSGSVVILGSLAIKIVMIQTFLTVIVSPVLFYFFGKMRFWMEAFFVRHK